MLLQGMRTASISSSSSSRSRCSSKVVVTATCVSYRSQCCIVIAGCCSCSRLQQGAAHSLQATLAVSALTNKLSISAVSHSYVYLLIHSFVASIPPCSVALIDFSTIITTTISCVLSSLRRERCVQDKSPQQPVLCIPVRPT